MLAKHLLMYNKVNKDMISLNPEIIVLIFTVQFSSCLLKCL